jgi:5-methylcytosine-specific restriction protein A
MPTSPAGFCSGKARRCTERAVYRGLCPGCHAEQQREYDARRETAAERGYDAQWRATRAAFLEEHPQCECDDCLALPAWRRPDAVDVDHRDGLGPRGPRGHDWSNLRAMTHGHHSRRTARDQPGGWARRDGG